MRLADCNSNSYRNGRISTQPYPNNFSPEASDSAERIEPPLFNGAL